MTTGNGRIIKAYFDRKPTLLALYSDKPDVVYATPPGTTPLAHVTYLKPKAVSEYWRSAVDYFLINGCISGLIGADPINLTENKVSPEMATTEIVHGVRFEFTRKARATGLDKVVRLAALQDIFLHTLNKPEPKIRSPYFTINTNLDEIRSMAKPTYAGRVKITAEGKQSFYPDCVLDLNADFAGWCSAAITPEGKLAPWDECTYCYAGYKHHGYPWILRADKKDLVEQIKKLKKERAELKEPLPTRFLRLGKKTEAADDLFIPNLIATFEAALETGLSIVLPTKHLRFYQEVADLARRTNSAIMPSIGNDNFERGPCLRGFSNDARLEIATKYLEAGVNAVPYVLVNATRENGGVNFEGNLKKALSKFPRVQILPIRPRHKNTAYQILEGWNDPVGQLGIDLFKVEVGGYSRRKDHTRIAEDIHPSLTKMIGDNSGDVRMCHHNSQKEYCGGCFMKGVCGAIHPFNQPKIEPRERRPHKGKHDKTTGAFKFMKDVPVLKQ
jgi:hypothetical protein